MKLITSTFTAAFGLMSLPLVAVEKNQPNIIFFLADDMGIGDAGCYGQKIIKTPNIDALASSGVQFMQHYSGSTVSAPSRCALMTGKHTGQAAIRGNGSSVVRNEDADLSLPLEEITVAEILKEKGYATACVGKWGLGGPQSNGSPVNQGFDYFFGYLSQGAAHRYYPEFLYENESKYPLNGQYSHTVIMQKGLEFIEKNVTKPFFAYFAVTPPHADLDIPDLGIYNNKFPETPHINNSTKGYKTQLQPKAAYAAMVSELDRNVGQIIELLKKKGIYENTIIIFSSDNGVHKVGGNDPDFFDSNGPFRGYKRDLYEGGIRAPFIVSWKIKSVLLMLVIIFQLSGIFFLQFAISWVPKLLKVSMVSLFYLNYCMITVRSQSMIIFILNFMSREANNPFSVPMDGNSFDCRLVIPKRLMRNSTISNLTRES